MTCIITILSIAPLTQAEAMVDPTRPPDQLILPSKRLKVTGALQVTAIFIYPSYRFAIINGQLGKPGDKVGEYTIINIQHDTVELKGAQDNSMVLPLLPSVKKARN